MICQIVSGFSVVGVLLKQKSPGRVDLF